MGQQKMRTRLILKPGQPGTKRLVEKYGDSLLCVRFKYDAESRQRLKTVELIVERTDWTPPPSRYTVDTLVPLRIEVADMPMRLQADMADSCQGENSFPAPLYKRDAISYFSKA
jgi:hypothetical protein